MRIGILTYYNVHNHGAVLQANGLKTILKKMGHQVEFLQFDRNYDMLPSETSKKYTGGLSSVPFYAKYLLEKGIGNVLFNYRKKSMLDNYRKGHIPLGSYADKFDGDLIVIGSDEVFSMEIGFNPCLYGLGLNCSDIISYAGCFGPTTEKDIIAYDKQDEIKAGLKGMKAISVRDENSQSVVKEIADENAQIVCDPVILYGYKNEMNRFVPKEKDYIVVYSYDRSMQDAEEIKQIKSFAKKHNKKLFSVSYYHSWCDKNIQATPAQLLGWIKNADCVITDTFHGSVLSIVCNTPMIVKLRDNKNKLGFLLHEYNLEDRIIDSFIDVSECYDKQIDFGCVNAIIKEKRKTSMTFLKNAIGD